MKAILIAVILVAGAFAHTQDVENLWASWKTQYGKSYADDEVESYRYAIFASNYAIVNSVNADPTSTVKLAMNQFADLTPEEFGAIYTGSFPVPSEVAEAGIVDVAVSDIPSSWDWRQEGAVTPVKNQEQCGGCWAFATVAASEGFYEISGNTLTSFSEQQIIDCDTKGQLGCSGGFPATALAYVAANGLETEAEYPFVGQNTKCTYDSSEAIQTGAKGAAFVTPKNATALTNAVYIQPVVVLIEADQSIFQLYSSGVIGAGCGVKLDHAVTAVGYTDSYFIIKNSWGTSWGDEGYVYISSSATINNGLGACGILTQPVYPSGLSN